MSAALPKIILVIDDDETIRETLVFVLEMEGYTVIEAKHGQEGLDKLFSSRVIPHLILMDLNMPVMNGHRFLDEIKSSLNFKAIPVIVMSCDLGQLSKHHSTCTRLTKPLDITNLLDVIQSKV